MHTGIVLTAKHCREDEARDVDTSGHVAGQIDQTALQMPVPEESIIGLRFLRQYMCI